MHWTDLVSFAGFLVKVLFVLAAALHLYYQLMPPRDLARDRRAQEAQHWAEQSFLVLSAVLLLYHFHPVKGVVHRPASAETRFLFFCLGWILLLSVRPVRTVMAAVASQVGWGGESGRNGSAARADAGRGQA